MRRTSKWDKSWYKGRTHEITATDVRPAADKSLGWAYRPDSITTHRIAEGNKKIREAEGRPIAERDIPLQPKQPQRSDNKITLKDLCERAGVHPKAARVKLRASKYKKPAEGWIFPSKDTKKILEIIS